MDSASKGTDNLRLYEASSSSTSQTASASAPTGPKGNGLDTTRQFPYVWYSPVMRPGVQYRPKVTENGYSERDNPPDALTIE